jgi:hypothetical protein
MATYYWVGGSGTWDTSTTTNWSLTSGGAGGAGVPTASDDVVFDVSSGPVFPISTVNITGVSAFCRSFSTTPTAPVIFTGSQLRVSGSFQLLSDPGGVGFAPILTMLPATTTGIGINSVAAFTLLRIWNDTGLATTVNLVSNINADSVFIEVGLVPTTSLLSIVCKLFDLRDSYNLPKVLGSASFALAIQIAPALATSGVNVYTDAWDDANASIINTTVTLQTNSNKNNIVSNTYPLSTTKQVDFVVLDGVTGFQSSGPGIKDLTITNAELRINGYVELNGSFVINGASKVTIDSPGAVSSAIVLNKFNPSPSISRTVIVPGTSQWIKAGLISYVSTALFDTVAISGSFGTLADPCNTFSAGAASIGAGTIYADDVTIANGTTFSSNVFNVVIFFTINTGASVTGTYTVNTSDANISPNGGTIPNLNIVGAGSLATLFQNMVVTNLSITAVSAKGGLQVQNGSSITVSGNLTIAGSSSVNNVELVGYTFPGPTLPWSIIKTSGTVNALFTTISYSNASGGAVFQALESNGCVDGGNNTGWIFKQSAGNFFLFL